MFEAGHEKKPSVLNDTVTGAGVGAGVVVLLALLIAIFVWRRKQSSKGKAHSPDAICPSRGFAAH